MKRILALFTILVLIGGYWFYQNRDLFFPKPEALQVGPLRWQVSSTDKQHELPGNTTVTNANMEQTQNASDQDNATQTTVAVDEIVRHDFVQDLSRYLVTRYLPGKTKKNPSAEGRFDLNPKSLNIRYGVDFTGFNVNQTDTLNSRKIIFNHVLQGPILDFLQAAYTPLFLDGLERALQAAAYTLPSGQKAPVTAEQRREMLTMLADRLLSIGHTVSALARTDAIRPLVATYLEDMEKVSQAHLTFWNRQAENASITDVEEASTRIKASIQTREISRQRLLQTIVTTTNPQGMDASELIYLAQWVYRRNLDIPQSLGAVAKAGEIIVRTAAAVAERALQPMPALETGEAGSVAVDEEVKD